MTVSGRSPTVIPRSRYTSDPHNLAWVKIPNRKYSQLIGRDELFKRRYEEAGAPEIGWEACCRAAVAISDK